MLIAGEQRLATTPRDNIRMSA